MYDDATRLDTLFASVKCFEQDYEYYHRQYSWTLKEFVDCCCFAEWKNRHRCLDVADYLKTIDYDRILTEARNGVLDDYLTLIEIIYNFWYLAIKHYVDNPEQHIIASKRSDRSCTAEELKRIMDGCLSDYNQKAFYFSEKEQCIISEDSPQVTAVAEATEPQVALEIVRYNHRQLAGDIAKKKDILRTLGDYLEGRKREINDVNASLYNSITGALNNLNIRHNNISPDNRSYYRKAVAGMPSKELEEHYDDLYQLILLAILEIDNVQRQRDMKELIQKVNE